MPLFSIACNWKESGILLIEANSLEEAIQKANDSESIPYPGEYIEGSLVIDDKTTKWLNMEQED